MKISRGSIFRTIADMEEKGERGAVVTIIESEGSTPRHDFARMVVKEDDSIVGTIGGGKIELKGIELAKESMQTGRVIRWRGNLQEIGMSCGGRVEILVEPIGIKPWLVIFGAGHVGTEVAYIGERLDFHIVVIDDREEFANKERFTYAKYIINSFEAEDWEKYIRFDNNTYCVIVTRGHAYDEYVLRQLLRYDNLAYLGMIGSKNKVRKVMERLKKEEVPEDKLKQIYSPIGLDIGSETPSEIAISILAQIIQIRRQNERQS